MAQGYPSPGKVADVPESAGKPLKDTGGVHGQKNAGSGDLGYFTGATKSSKTSSSAGQSVSHGVKNKGSAKKGY